jgi:6-phosphogluconolactonase (cycloisomerase 2 family)
MARTLVRRRVALALVAALASVGLAAARADAALPEGGLTQLPGLTGCLTTTGLSEDGPGTCSAVPSLTAPESVAISPGGTNLYVGSYDSSTPTLPSTMTIFARNPATGAVTPLPGKSGCISTDGSSGAGANTCATARGFIHDGGDGLDLVFTSDGRWAYMAAQNSPSSGTKGDILIFQRDPSTGALTQLPGMAGCISSDGSSQAGASTCQTDITLASPQGISISPDDKFVYAADYLAPYRIHVFFRSSDGTLTSVQCLQQTPATLPCTTARVVGNSQSVVISPNGLYAYSGSYSVGISAFKRDPATGLLTQLPGQAGCLSDDGKDDASASTCGKARVLKGNYVARISPDGKTLYETASNDHGLSVFHVNSDGSLSQLPGTEGCITIDGKDSDGFATCTVGREVNSLYGEAISPDGHSLYVSQDVNTTGGVAALSLDPATGAATQLPGLAGCVSVDGSSNGTSPGVCANGRGLADSYGMVVSPDGRFVYQANELKQVSGLAIFARATTPACQATSATAAKGGPATITLTCSDADGDPISRLIASQPAHGKLGAINQGAGTVTYTPAKGYSGSDSFTFEASDGANTSGPATATLTVSKFPGSSLASKTLIVDAKGHLKIRLRCPAGSPGGSCRDTIALYSLKGKLPRSAKRKAAKAVLLAKGSFSVKAGKTVTKTLRLGKAGRKLARTHAKFKARLILKSHGASTATVKHSYRVTVKHAKAKRTHRR